MKSTHHSILGFQTNSNHEIRVRCKMLAGDQFGDFSQSVFVPSGGKHSLNKVWMKKAVMKVFQLYVTPERLQLNILVTVNKPFSVPAKSLSNSPLRPTADHQNLAV